MSVPAPTSVPVQEIFRRTGNWSRGNVANDSGIVFAFVFNHFLTLNSLKLKMLYIVTEGIQLTGYHRLGTIHITRPIQRHNNDVNDVANLDAESVRKLAAPKESTLRYF